ncbi:rod shape-determining protein RodA [Candidatus Shapirobacteria bacterium]|nr:rod shape-determining protein RodA [Candidatus Shapirobacteria bacterium]
MLRFFRNFDWLLLLLALIIAFLGMIILKSIVPSLLTQQIIWLVLGLFFFFVFSQIDYQNYRRWAWVFYFACLIFLLITVIFGQVTRGAVRWLEIGSFRLQPSELVKPFLILFFAAFFSEQEQMDLKKTLLALLLLALPFLLIFLQPDLGSSLVVLFFWLGIVLAKGVKSKWLGAFFGFFIVLLPLIWRFLLKDYQRQRIFTFLNPQADPLGAGFNVIQSKIAIGSGQFFGRGLGRGTQSHLRFLPERHTDFIFASLAEELGFLGGLILLALFFCLLWRILVLAKASRNEFAFLIGVGVFSLIFIQMLINIGMNGGLLPVTGITLPLVSYGGSSLISTFMALGIVNSLTKGQEENQTVEIR